MGTFLHGKFNAVSVENEVESHVLFKVGSDTQRGANPKEEPLPQRCISHEVLIFFIKAKGFDDESFTPIFGLKYLSESSQSMMGLILNFVTIDIKHVYQQFELPPSCFKDHNFTI